MEDASETEQRPQAQIFWSPEMSSCDLRFLARLVADGIRVDKGFKNSHYNQCAKVVTERYHVKVSGAQVTNHLKTWRTKWTNILAFKKISSAHFDEETGTITLDEKNYQDRVQKRPSEAKYFNKPIENYHYMAVIFGNQQATRLFAKGTNDPLAAETSETADTYSVGSEDMPGRESNNANPTRDGVESSNRGSGRRRRRVMVEDDDPLIYTVTEAFKNLSDAIKQSAPPPPPPTATIPPNLWTSMKQIPLFDREHLAHYFAYLCEKPALANAFLSLHLMIRWCGCQGTSKTIFLGDAY